VRRKTVRVAYITDPHCPLQNEKATAWAISRIADYRPDYVVVGGDVFEADSASRFYNEQPFDLVDEYKAASRWLDLVHDSAPNARHHWLLGNHCSNLQAIGRIDKRLRRAVNWNTSEWGESFRRWTQHEYDFSPGGCLQLGQVLFWHGFDGAEDHNAVRILNATGGHAHRLVVGGHTHKPHGPTQIMRTKSIGLPMWYANGGTLGPTRPGWTQRQDTSLWAAAIVRVELTMGRSCQPAKNWACDVEVMQ
jgi:hypothetical protein